MIPIVALAQAFPCAAQEFTANDRAAVIYAVHQAVSPSAAVNIQKAAGGYARVQVTMGGTDPARVYLHKIDGRWKVIAGPGTAWSPAELNRLGIPPSLR